MLHRGGGGLPTDPWPTSADPFDASTDDPARSNALESSLWELPLLAGHYFGPAARLARTLVEGGGVVEREALEVDVSEATGSGATYAGWIRGEWEKTTKRGG